MYLVVLSRTFKGVAPCLSHLLYSMRVLHSSAFSDVHLCGVNTSRLEKIQRQNKMITVNTDVVLHFRCFIFYFTLNPKTTVERYWRKGRGHRRKVTGESQTEAYHRSMDVPEGSLLAVKNLPLSFILFPVYPANEISQCERLAAAFLLSALDAAVESG